MLLKELIIYKLPGMKQKGLFFINGAFKKGVNIIYGPNASGKTTLCNVIKALLWPDIQKKSENISINSIWEIDDREIEISISDRKRNVNGILENSFLKKLPPSYLSSCFTIDALDLNISSDHLYAERIIKEAYGGVDIEKAKKTFSLPRLFGRKEWNNLKEREKEIKEVQNHLSSLLIKEKKLFFLEESIKKSNLAKDNLIFIKDKKELFDLTKKLEKTNLEIQQLPSNLEMFRKDDLEILENISEEKEKKIKELKENKQNLAVIENKLQDFLNVFIDEDLETLNKYFFELKKCNDDLLDIQENLEKENKLLQECNIAYEKLGNLDDKYIKLIIPLIDRKRHLIFKISAVEKRLLLFSNHIDNSIENFIKGIRLLKRWKSIFWGGLASVFVSIILSHFLSTYLDKVLLVGFVLGFNIISYLFFKKKYRLLKLSSISFSNLFKFNHIIEDLQHHLFEKKRFLKEKELLEKELKENLREINEVEFEFKKFEEEIGVHFDTDIDPNIFLSKILQIKKRYEKIQDLIANKKITAANVSQLQNNVNALLKSCNKPCMSDIDNLNSVIDDIKKERTDKKDLLKCFHATQLSVDNLNVQFKFLEEKEETIFKRCGVKDLSQWKEKFLYLQEFIHLDFTRRESLIKIDILNQKLQGSTLDNVSYDDVENYEKQFLKDAENLSSYIEEKTKIVNEISIAKQARLLEKTENNLLTAKNEFSEVFDKSFSYLAANYLLEKVEDEYRLNSHQNLFSKANLNFSSFTENSCSLLLPSFNKKEYAFFIKDHENNNIKGIDQLSQGTRMQLLLAVRLAFSIQDKMTIPYFLDEALSNTDDNRFSLIANSLFKIAQDHQIFYFTCQKSDIDLWNRVAEQENFDINVININDFSKHSSDVELDNKTFSKNNLEDTAINFFLDDEESLSFCQKYNINTYRDLIDKKHLSLSFPFEAIDEKMQILKKYFYLNNPFSLSYSILSKMGVSKNYALILMDILSECNYDLHNFIKILEGKKDDRIKFLRKKNIDKLKKHIEKNRSYTKKEENDITLRENLLDELKGLQSLNKKQKADFVDKVMQMNL